MSQRRYVKTVVVLGVVVVVVGGCSFLRHRRPSPAVVNGLIALADFDGSEDIQHQIPRHQIFSMRPDGTDRVQLTHDKGSTFRQNWMPSWSPDGKKIAYVHHTEDGMRIKVMDADGSNTVTLTNAGLSQTPAWSPDGKMIAYAHSDRYHGFKLWVMTSDGTHQRALTTGPEPIEDNVPTWSPDGTRIAFTSNREGGKYRIWVMNADGAGLKPLTENSVDTRLDTTIEQKVPAWSPDGKYIAYWQGVEMTELSEALRKGLSPPTARDRLIMDTWYVWVMNADGTSNRRLAHGDDPAWSPDNTTIIHPVHQHFSTTGKLALGGVSPDGSNERILFFTNGSFARASWQRASGR